jgi:DNA repair exonuclease SbcCD ATPase subunit
MNDTILGSSNAGSINDTTMFHSLNQSTLENSLEKTADQQTLNEFQQKLSSARDDVKGLKNLLRDAKGVMKDLAVNPTKSSDPGVLHTLGNIYQKFQKAEDGFGNDLPQQETSLENTQLERTTDHEVIKQMGQKIVAARNEVKGLKTLLHHAKVVMRQLAEDPTKSSDPRVQGAFDVVYKQFKKVGKKSVSFDEY